MARIVNKTRTIRNPAFTLVRVRGTVSISDRVIADAIQAMLDWYGVLLRRAQLLRYLRRNPGLTLDLCQFGVETANREMLADEIAKDIWRARWPIFGDGAARWKAFCAACAKHPRGIRFERLPQPERIVRRLRRCQNAVPVKKKAAA